MIASKAGSEMTFCPVASDDDEIFGQDGNDRLEGNDGTTVLSARLAMIRFSVGPDWIT